nr:dTDP-4-dehydrorhamnose reductase [Caldimonas mangrovi]
MLLLGGQGQVGWELQRALALLGEVVAPTRAEADLTRPDSLRRWVQAVQPQVIVNAAGHTAVDRAETERELAWQCNAEAAGMLAEQAAARGAWLVHFSSDYVFDGSGQRPWLEDDEARPLNVYGSSKLESEARVRACAGRHLILRTSWVHAARRSNFVAAVLRRAGAQESLCVVDDQIGAPTGAELVADVTAHALRVALLQPEVSGTYHLAAAGAASRFEVARHVLAWAHARGHVCQRTLDALRPMSSEHLHAPARRPLNSRLDTGKLQRCFGVALPPWQVGVERVLTELLEHQREAPP